MTPDARLAVLEQQVAILRADLREQWRRNHVKHCSNEWPHHPGQRCGWVLPVSLGGHPEAHRSYEDATKQAEAQVAKLMGKPDAAWEVARVHRQLDGRCLWCDPNIDCQQGAAALAALRNLGLL